MRRDQLAALDLEDVTKHREGQPRKVVALMDATIAKLDRAAKLDERGDGDAAERLRLEIQHDMKVLVWRLTIARLATQELDRRREDAA